MRRFLIVLTVLYAIPAPVFAETAFAGSLDIGLAGTKDSNDVVYEVGYTALNLGVAIEKKNWTLAIQAGVPIPPGITIQTPISLRLHPIGRTKTRPYLMVRLRPIYFTLVGCQECEDFLREDQRAPSSYGATGDAGLGYQFAIGKTMLLSVGLAYTGGYLVPRELNEVTVPQGFFQGGIFNLAFSADL